jgi:hypothetical protein
VIRTKQKKKKQQSDEAQFMMIGRMKKVESTSLIGDENHQLQGN